MRFNLFIVRTTALMTQESEHNKLAVLTDDEFERNEQGVPKWFNINYEDVDGNEMYQTFELKNFDETPYYSLESINDI